MLLAFITFFIRLSCLVDRDMLCESRSLNRGITCVKRRTLIDNSSMQTDEAILGIN